MWYRKSAWRSGPYRRLSNTVRALPRQCLPDRVTMEKAYSMQWNGIWNSTQGHDWCDSSLPTGVPCKIQYSVASRRSFKLQACNLPVRERRDANSLGRSPLTAVYCKTSQQSLVIKLVEITLWGLTCLCFEKSSVFTTKVIQSFVYSRIHVVL